MLVPSVTTYDAGPPRAAGASKAHSTAAAAIPISHLTTLRLQTRSPRARPFRRVRALPAR